MGVVEDLLSLDSCRGSRASFFINTEADMSILNPELLEVISKAGSVEQVATNDKLHVLDGENVAVKCKVTLNLTVGETRVEQQF